MADRKKVTKKQVDSILRRLAKGESGTAAAEAIGVAPFVGRHVARLAGYMPGSKYLAEAKRWAERHGLEVGKKG